MEGREGGGDLATQRKSGQTPGTRSGARYASSLVTVAIVGATHGQGPAM